MKKGRCPYCGSGKTERYSLIRSYSLSEENVDVRAVLCGRCGGSFTATIRTDLATGKNSISTVRDGVKSPSLQRTIKFLSYSLKRLSMHIPRRSRR